LFRIPVQLYKSKTCKHHPVISNDVTAVEKLVNEISDTR